MFSIFSTEPLQVLPDSTEPDWFRITEERTFRSSAFWTGPWMVLYDWTEPFRFRITEMRTFYGSVFRLQNLSRFFAYPTELKMVQQTLQNQKWFCSTPFFQSAPINA